MRESALLADAKPLFKKPQDRKTKGLLEVPEQASMGDSQKKTLIRDSEKSQSLSASSKKECKTYEGVLGSRLRPTLLNALIAQ